jgi:hypothetical protein
MAEFVELMPRQKQAFLKRYAEIAGEFYGAGGAGDRPVSDREVGACIRQFKEKPLPKYRKRIVLKRWKFKLDTGKQGTQRRYFSEAHDDSKWERVAVPHTAKYIPPKPEWLGRLDSNIVKTPTVYQASYDTWYRAELPLEALEKDQTAALRFESVHQTSTVWLNDNPVMLDHLGLYPYSLDVGDELRRQKGKRLSIAVRARSIVTNRPNMFYGTWQYAYRNPPYTRGADKEDWDDQAAAGIAGPVVLDVLSGSHLEDVVVETLDIGKGSASMVCRLDLRNTTWQGFSGRIRVEIRPWLPKEGRVIQTETKEVQVLPMGSDQIRLAFEMRKPALWDTDNPNMYLAHVVLEDEHGKPIDDVYETFGVRTIRMQGSALYLNNRRIVPRGTHNSTVYRDESEVWLSDRIIVKEILLHKKLGSNCSRWPSDKSMHCKRIAEWCDQLGYMVSWCGWFQIWSVHPEMEMYAARDLKSVVRSLRNHPSIIFWELGDEALWWEHHFRRQRWYLQVYDLVSAEDSTRPIIPSGHWAEELMFRIENLHKEGMGYARARTAALKELPVYGRELACWDYHHCPSGPPTLPVIEWAKRTLGGKRPTVFTEFGVHGLPEFSRVKDVYGKFRWESSPFFIIKGGQKAYANYYYGKQIGPEDWRYTQAAQAAVLTAIITRLRQNPEVFAAYYLLTMFDVWTFYWGLVDVHGNAKLAYYVVRSCFQPVFVSGLDGNAVVKAGDAIAVTVSNYDDDINNAALRVSVKDRAGRAVKEETYKDLTIKGGVSLTTVGNMALEGIKPGLYSIEYRLKTRSGVEAAKSLELFFMT